MKLKVEHITSFGYNEPISETATEVRLQPRSDEGAPQKCLDFVLQLKPLANIEYYTDFYGNNVHHFNILQSHKQIEIRAVSIVETREGYVPALPGEEIMRLDFLNPSRYVQFDQVIREYSQQFVGLEMNNRQLAEEISRRINAGFAYDKSVTDVHSTSIEVMALKRGVCQDFAHIMIAVCRCVGLPARYVSGYLYTGSAAEGQAGASHAWCEVFCGPEVNGWVAFDPTHRNLLTDERYIKIGIGRDYDDIPPVRGTFKGRTDEHMNVVVLVTDLSQPLPAFES